MLTKFNIKPGDLIEWACLRDGMPVLADEMLWSTTEKGWVPIGRELTHLCVSREGEIVTWLNERGIFRACEDDEAALGGLMGGGMTVYPRVRR